MSWSWWPGNAFNCPDTMRVADSMLFKGLFVPNAFSPNNPHGEVRQFKPAGINLEDLSHAGLLM
ncbi:MAG: hypothetical protein U5L09_07225 [Bacteroidales bacterium]|nr:hypothetical protein [Bacteroidales bacterium]